MPRILLIEDDPLQRDIYTSLLYYNGFDVESAPDAEVGIETARAAHPDAILMDVMLPGMNGLSAASVLHEDPITSTIPVICMSAYGVDRHRAYRSGAKDFLAKPVRGDVLVRSIRRLIGWDDH